MAYKLQLKRGASGSLPTGSAGEPLFTTDTNDLYIGTGGANQRFQKYIASGTSAQFLKGDGSLDSTTYTPTSRTLTINGTSLDLSANRTFNVGTVTTAAATTGGQVAFFNGATVITSVSGLYFDGVDKLGIGTASPTYNLDVTGTARMTSSSNLQTLYLQNSGTGYGLYNQADSYFQGDVKFQSVSNTILKVDSSNKLIAAVAGTDYQAPITNPVTGTGTTNYLPKWTSGSALGNSLIYDNGTNVGIGTASPDSKFHIAPSNGVQIRFDYVGSGDNYYDGVTHYFRNGNGAANVMTLKESANVLIGSTSDNGNRLQVTGNGYFSGSLGVGTSTLAGKLTILNGSNFTPTATSSIGGTATQRLHILGGESGLMLSSDVNPSTGVQTGTQAYQLGLQIGFYGVNDIRNQIYFGNAPLTFVYSSNQGTSVTERLRIDPSGNLGLGVVPSAWGSQFRAMQIGSGLNGGSVFGDAAYSVLHLASNVYYDGTNFKYIKTGEAAAQFRVYAYDGSFIWDRANSGTAGNTITWTQAMTLTANGRLLLGTTTEGTYLLDVNGNVRALSTGTTDTNVLFEGNGSYLKIKGRASYATLQIDGTGTNNWDLGILGETTLRLRENGNSRLSIASGGAATFSSSVNINGASTVNALNIYDSNNAGITFHTPFTGTTASDGFYIGQLFQSSNFLFRNRENADIIFETNNGSERMRITSGGNLLVGTTTDSGQKLCVNGDVKIGTYLYLASEGSGTVIGDISTGNYLRFLVSNGEKMRIKSNGSVRYVPMATPGTAEAGDVYYDSTSNKLRCYNGTSWNDLF